MPSGWGSEMAAERNLIVNADDLGYTDGVNAGIFEAHSRGIVTSASMMVRRTAAADAARLAADHLGLAIGLHVDIGQWDYENGAWTLAYSHCSPEDGAAVERECVEQLEAFRTLLGRDPTHLDSHQHVHRSEPVAAVAARMASQLGVPLRGAGIRYEGGFYGQTGKGEPYAEGISVERLLELIRSLQPGWTEVGCHPGIGVEETETSYAHEREREVEALCDPQVKRAIEDEGILLRSFAAAR